MQKISTKQDSGPCLDLKLDGAEHIERWGACPHLKEPIVGQWCGHAHAVVHTACSLDVLRRRPVCKSRQFLEGPHMFKVQWALDLAWTSGWTVRSTSSDWMHAYSLRSLGLGSCVAFTQHARSMYFVAVQLASRGNVWKAHTSLKFSGLWTLPGPQARLSGVH